MAPEVFTAFGPDKALAQKLYNTFIDAKEYGSILTPDVTEAQLNSLEERLRQMEERLETVNLVDQANMQTALAAFRPIMVQARALVQKYDVTVTNPPYMGLRNMSAILFDYVMSKHQNTKQDLFGVFM